MTFSEALPNHSGRPRDHSPRVLIVDDEEEIRSLLSDILTGEGYRCRSCSTAEEAWEELAARPYLLAMIDIRLPGMSGMELLRKINGSLSSPVATILLTAVSNLEMAVRAMKLGAYDYITKPFTSETVTLRAAQALDKRRLILENLDYRRNLEEKVQKQSENIQGSLLKTIEALSRTLEAKDPVSREHAQRVIKYSSDLARELALSPQEIENVRIAALLHDIGKLGVSEKILENPHPLQDDEVEHIKRHPLVAEKILGPIEDLKEIIQLVKHHHERWDGTGYPDRLKGEEIPLGSRIISLADAYDAMTSSRVYRVPFSPARAIAEIKDKAGSQFDPALVSIFIRIL
jgi:putative nucleotidyltransferase with HDIG domain